MYLFKLDAMPARAAVVLDILLEYGANSKTNKSAITQLAQFIRMLYQAVCKGGNCCAFIAPTSQTEVLRHA